MTEHAPLKQSDALPTCAECGQVVVYRLGAWNCPTHRDRCTVNLPEETPMEVASLDLRALRAASVSRAEQWHDTGSEPWSGADWSNAMCGEAGEAANVVKKLRRIETNIAKRGAETAEEFVAMLGDEIADVVIYADLLANHYGIDLAAHVRSKFNEVSDRHGFAEKL